MQIFLDRTFIYQGKFYGPGTVKVADDVGKALAERMQALQPAAPDEVAPNAPADENPLAAFEALTAAGYDVERARAASDDELLDVPGIGRATLKKIREALAE